MSGMINATPAQPPGGASSNSSLGNPLLQNAEDAIEAKLTPANQVDYTKVVVAGLHIALANGANSFMAKLLHSADPIGDCAKAAVSLVLIMRKEAKGVMPMQAAIPAGLTLVLHGLDFIDHAGIVKIGEPELDRASAMYTNALLQRVGVTPQMLQHAAGTIHGITQDPAAMAKINQKAGIVRAPGAAPFSVPGTAPATAGP